MQFTFIVNKFNALKKNSKQNKKRIVFHDFIHMIYFLYSHPRFYISLVVSDWHHLIMLR